MPNHRASDRRKNLALDRQMSAAAKAETKTCSRCLCHVRPTTTTDSQGPRCPVCGAGFSREALQ